MAAQEMQSPTHCYCGGSLDTKKCTYDTILCCNCFEFIGKGNTTNWCAFRNCKFNKKNGFRFNLCNHCAKSLSTLAAGDATIEKLLRFALETASNQKKRKQRIMDQKLYAYRLRFVLYRMIYNYSSRLTQTAYDELYGAFDSLYTSIIDEVHRAVNHHELELNDYVLCPHSKEESEEKQSTLSMKLQKEIRMHWYTLNDGTDTYSTCAMECDNIFVCKCVLRISYLLDLYSTHHIQRIGGFINVFGSCLASYRLRHLINDFLHCLDHHHTEFDLKALKQGSLITLCKDKDCASESDRFEQNQHQLIRPDAELETSDTAILSYLQLLHSYFSHKNGTLHETLQLKKDVLSKFQTQIDDDETCAKEQSSSHTDELQIDDDEKPKEVKLNQFSFGHKFFYWSYFSDYAEYISQSKYNSLKEELLKNEIYPLSLRLFNTFLEQTAQLFGCYKAKQMKGKPRGMNNQKYAIPVGLGLTMPHLMVLMLYTNCTQLQFKFKKHGTRRLKPSDTMETIKSRNTQIANWFRLLYEAVLIFGDETTRSRLFYHGISVPLLFDQFSPLFEAPISTTTAISVARRFGENGIVIALKPNDSRADLCFDVKWLSAFPEEDERLFVQASNLNIVDIRESHRFKFNNTKYVRAIRVLDEMLKSYYLMVSASENRKQNTQNLLFMLANKIVQNKCKIDEIAPSLSRLDTSLLLHFISNNAYDSDALLYDISNGDNSMILNHFPIFADGQLIASVQNALEQIPLYILQLLRHLIKIKMNSNQDLLLIRSDYEQLNNKLKSGLFMNGGANASQAHLVCRLFANSHCKIRFIDEFLWVIDETTFAKFKKKRIGLYIKGEECVYSCSEKVHVGIIPDMTRSDMEYPEYCSFGFTLKSLPEHVFAVKAFLSVKFDEVKYCLNGKSKILHNNAYMGYKVFQNKLLDQIKHLTVRISLKLDLIDKRQ